MVNVSQESGAFFQTDAEIAKQKEKLAKLNYTEGDAIKLSTKALEIHASRDEKYMYVAESGFFVRKISLSVSKRSIDCVIKQEAHPILFRHRKLSNYSKATMDL
jgi:hypothetical protein